MAGRRLEVLVFSILAREFAFAPAVGDYGDARPVGGGRFGLVHVRIVGRRGLEQDDVGFRCHRVGPLHVERFLEVPVADRRVGVRRQRRAAVFVQHLERRAAGVELRQAEIRVEGGRVGDDVRIVVGVDDGDGLTGAVADDSIERNQVHAVRRLHLRRRVRRRGIVRRNAGLDASRSRHVAQVDQRRHGNAGGAGGNGRRKHLPAFEFFDGRTTTDRTGNEGGISSAASTQVSLGPDRLGLDSARNREPPRKQHPQTPATGARFGRNSNRKYGPTVPAQRPSEEMKGPASFADGGAEIKT